MVRRIEKFSVTQRTSDGFFDGSELLRQWNSVDGNSKREMKKFLDSPSTQEFLTALAIDENERKSPISKMRYGDNQQVKTTDLIIMVKGRNTKSGKTPDKVWMNPLLFIKFAMWINPVHPTFRVIRQSCSAYSLSLKYRSSLNPYALRFITFILLLIPSTLPVEIWQSYHASIPLL